MTRAAAAAGKRRGLRHSLCYAVALSGISVAAEDASHAGEASRASPEFIPRRCEALVAKVQESGKFTEEAIAPICNELVKSPKCEFIAEALALASAHSDFSASGFCRAMEEAHFCSQNMDALLTSLPVSDLALGECLRAKPARDEAYCKRFQHMLSEAVRSDDLDTMRACYMMQAYSNVENATKEAEISQETTRLPIFDSASKTLDSAGNGTKVDPFSTTATTTSTTTTPKPAPLLPGIVVKPVPLNDFGNGKGNGSSSVVKQAAKEVVPSTVQKSGANVTKQPPLEGTIIVDPQPVKNSIIVPPVPAAAQLKVEAAPAAGPQAVVPAATTAAVSIQPQQAYEKQQTPIQQQAELPSPPPAGLPQTQSAPTQPNAARVPQPQALAAPLVPVVPVQAKAAPVPQQLEPVQQRQVPASPAQPQVQTQPQLRTQPQPQVQPQTPAQVLEQPSVQPMPQAQAQLVGQQLSQSTQQQSQAQQAPQTQIQAMAQPQPVAHPLPQSQGQPLPQVQVQPPPPPLAQTPLQALPQQQQLPQPQAPHPPTAVTQPVAQSQVQGTTQQWPSVSAAVAAAQAAASVILVGVHGASSHASNTTVHEAPAHLGLTQAVSNKTQARIASAEHFSKMDRRQEAESARKKSSTGKRHELKVGEYNGFLSKFVQ